MRNERRRERLASGTRSLSKIQPIVVPPRLWISGSALKLLCATRHCWTSNVKKRTRSVHCSPGGRL